MVNKFTLLTLGTILVAGSAIAGEKVSLNSPVVGKKADIQTLMQKHSENAALRGPKKESGINNVITEVPGTEKIYTKSAVGYDQGAEYDESDMASAIVFGENNEVYIRDILTSMGANSYVKGVLNGDVITVSLPQTVYYSETYDYGVNVCMMQINSAQTNYEVTDIESVELSYNAETGVITLELDDPYEYILGAAYSDDDSWLGFGDIYQEYEPTDLVANGIPAGVEVEEWAYSDGYNAYNVGVAIDGDTLYIKGLSQSLPGGVIMAEINGNKANVSGGQVIGTYVYYLIYTMVADYDGQSLTMVDNDYILDLDLENKTIVGSNGNTYLLYNAGYEEPYYLDVFNEFAIIYQESYAGTPVNPFGLDVYDYMSTYGSYDFSFFVPNVSTEGTMLQTDSFYYRIYVDGKLFELDEKTYMGVSGVISNIPYNFQNGFDIYSDQGDPNRVVALYFDTMTTLGVQSVYIYDGETTESAVVTLNLETGDITEGDAGVDTINVSDVMNVTYFDLNGRKVSNPDKGVYVVKMQLNDGSSVTRKVVRR